MRLKVREDNPRVIASDFKGSAIAMIGSIRHITTSMTSEEMARRMVACWNACEGEEVTTERLESGALNVRDLIDAAFRASEAHVQTRGKLDAVLAPGWPGMKLNKLFCVSLYSFDKNERARCVLTADDQQDAESKAAAYLEGFKVTSCRFICDTPATIFEEL